MKPSNKESPDEKKDQEHLHPEADPRGGTDYFDPVSGSSVTAGPSHQNTEADRELEEDLPKASP
jgi:hypothetical protein